MALKVTLLFTTASSGTLANGVYRCPARMTSEWISSASTTTSCSRASRPMRSSSSSVHTLPVGFCGLQTMIARTSAVIFDSRSSQSIS